MMYESSYTKGLSGTVLIPGDKSISHRAVMFSALAEGRSKIEGLLEGDDVLATASIMEALGADIEKKDGIYFVDGVGFRGVEKPLELLDCGNSGTSMRLLSGLLAGQQIEATLIGDVSLSNRPMKRVLTPLSQMGASVDAKDDIYPPLVIRPATLKPITYRLPVASAQVESCILLAGLCCDGMTTVIETEKSRDHTEKMLNAFGAHVIVEEKQDETHISVQGRPVLRATDIRVPADPSSAAFFIVAALITEGSELFLPNIMLNETRTGLITTLLEMGADIQITNEREENAEKVGDITVRSSDLQGIEVPASRAVSMIDEYPILSIAAACARGQTVMHGIKELRVKETDRIAAMEAGLKSCGVSVVSTDDSMTVSGADTIEPTSFIQTHHDHRIAMSFLTLGLVSTQDIVIDDISMIKTSFPNFLDLMEMCGANMKPFVKRGVA